MEQSNSLHFDMDKLGKAVRAYVRARAIQNGSLIAYVEKGQIVKENPRTGQKTTIKATSNK
jgi:uncharacterized lipoprotein YbaY